MTVCSKYVSAIVALALATSGCTPVKETAATAHVATIPAGQTANAGAASTAAKAVNIVDQAIAKSTATTERNPRDEKAWIALGNALMQKARETADVSYYGNAENAYQHVLTLDPNCVPAMIGMGWVTSDRHEFEKSKTWVRRALVLDPTNNDAYGLWGDADQELGDYGSAYKHYQTMINLRPDLASYSRGAHLVWITGDFRKGVLMMSKAIDAGGSYAESTAWCRAQLALMLFNNGNQKAAENTLDAALKTNPNNYRVLMALGKVTAGRGDVGAAIGYYERSIAVVPQLDAVVALGDLYQLTGQQERAQEQFTLAEKIDQLQKAGGVRGGWPMALFRANHNRELGKAVADAREEYKTRKNVYAADALAWCLYKHGDAGEAKPYSDAALRLRTPEPGFLYHAGTISLKLGDRAAALRDLEAAIKLNRNFSPVDGPAAAAALKQLQQTAKTN